MRPLNDTRRSLYIASFSSTCVQWYVAGVPYGPRDAVTGKSKNAIRAYRYTGGRIAPRTPSMRSGRGREETKLRSSHNKQTPATRDDVGRNLRRRTPAVVVGRVVELPRDAREAGKCRRRSVREHGVEARPT